MKKNVDLPTLTGLIAFEATVRNASMTLAAQELDITQPLVSQRIRALEELLGGVLIDRSRKPLAATAAGYKFYKEIQTPLSILHQSVNNVQKDLQETKIKISISAYFGFAYQWIIPRLQRLQEAFPDYLFEIHPTNSLSDMMNSNADILFHFASKVGKYQYEELLIPEVVFPVCSPAFADSLALIKGDSLTDLRNLPLLHKERDDPRWFTWQSWSELLSIKPSDSPIMFYYNNYPLVVEAAIAGQGICLGWEGLINQYIDDGKLIELGPRLKATNRGYLLCSDFSETLAVGNVIRWFKKEVKNSSN